MDSDILKRVGELAILGFVAVIGIAVLTYCLLQASTMLGAFFSHYNGVSEMTTNFNNAVVMMGDIICLCLLFGQIISIIVISYYSSGKNPLIVLPIEILVLACFEYASFWTASYFIDSVTSNSVFTAIFSNYPLSLKFIALEPFIIGIIGIVALFLKHVSIKTYNDNRVDIDSLPED